MEPYRVFVSSILNRSKEDLNAEREAALAAINHFSPITRAWAFEAEPASSKSLEASYLDEVKTCDLLILLLGKALTVPTKAEFQTARDFAKPVLIFCKDVAPRDPELEEFVRVLDAKYERFTNATDLRGKVQTALGFEILRQLRGENVDALKPGERIARLRRLAQEGGEVRVSPLVPDTEGDLFRVALVEDGLVTVKKCSSGHHVVIPAARITEILLTNAHEPPILMLQGRLQWLTLKGEWIFLPDAPDRSDGLCLGIPEESQMSGPRLDWLKTQLDPKDLKIHWARRDNLAKRLGERTHEVFYNEQGRYLRVSGPDTDSILLVSRP